MYKNFKVNGKIFFEAMNLITDEIVPLPDSRSEYVVNEIVKFWERKERFDKMTFAYKTGIILYGPPGSGKTITVHQLIQDIIRTRGGIAIMAEHPGTTTEAIHDFRRVEKDRPIVVILEDIDSIIDRYGEPELLSLLDGENQTENVVFVATTNYPERLDVRFIDRPGRFDMVIKIDMPNAEARATYITKKIGKTVIKGGDGIDIDLVKGTEGLSIAHIREVIRSIFLMDHEPAEVVKRVNRMKYTPKSTGNKKMGLENE
jgi:SpoVK/Ycf46/Vps4 family AAA+-type ATPase